MPDAASFQSFEKEVSRLAGIFERSLAGLKSPGYVEAQLRDDFLNPFFRALGWDLENSAGLIQSKREVEIESRTEIAGRQKRADYLFRAEGRDRFVCEAKKPAEELHSHQAFQAKRYAWNKNLPLAILTNFEEFKIYIVGGRPYLEEPLAGLWKTWTFRQLPPAAREVWNLLARERIAAGSIDQLIDTLPKTASGKGKARQQWLLRPDPSRALDAEFLNFLDGARRELGFDLMRNNDRADLLEGNKLNEAVQRIMDRILFLRICEARDIDTGVLLESIVETWQRNYNKEDGVRAHQRPLELHEEPPSGFGGFGLRAPKESLWRAVVRHFRALDRRPATHVPFFNGNLFKPHFSEELVVGDAWLAGFVGDLSDEESPYLFSYIPVEILGTIYERFLGKVVRPQGRGVTIEEKPEVRKAGGVYYTPRYIVEYIVAQTVEKLLHDANPEASLKLRFLDPACGSGSFLLRVFEAACEHWQQWLTQRPGERKKKWCWADEKTGDVHLTMALKRRILTSNVFGVDIDPGAVEVTQLSLYLKMLENENRNTLEHQRKLLPDDDDALLPPLENNIQCGNSLIASDFSVIPDDLVRVRAFDWNVGFKEIMKSGGFDAVVGNPPYGRLLDEPGEEYAAVHFPCCRGIPDVYLAFIERDIGLLKMKGRMSLIVPSAWLGGPAHRSLRGRLLEYQVQAVIALPFDVFADAYIDTAIFVLNKQPADPNGAVRCFAYPKKTKLESIKLTERQYSHVPLSVWRGSPDLKFVLSAGLANLVSRLSQAWETRIGDFVEMKRGVLFDRRLLKATKANKQSHRYFEGDVYRYDLNFAAPGWVEYGPKMREWPKQFRWFEGERLLMRRLVSRRQRLMTALAEDTFITNKNLYSLLVRPEAGLKDAGPGFMLGVLNSRLVSRLYLSQVQQASKDDFPQVTIADVLGLPCPRPAGRLPAQISGLAGKLSVLMPRLRQARSEAERKTLQNAATAADEQIDGLVYELYGLTEKEIQLVENGAQ
jgi:hypothetical protein